MTEGEFVRFGARKVFAVEARLTRDPEADGVEDGWSYGDLRIYVRDRCLTRHTAPGGIRDEVRWYLAPLFRWLRRVWLPLFHEQALPPTVGRHENPIVRFEQGERLLLEDESGQGSARRADMQAWRNRHALWSAAAGGVFPNIWFRRQSDLCEISYDPGVTVGAPRAFEFQFSRGVALVDLDAVAQAFLGFLKWGASTADPSGGDVELSTDPSGDAEAAERWLIGDHLAAVLAGAGVQPPKLDHGVLYPLSAEVAMFGTLTPNLSRDDAVALLAALSVARSAEPDPPALQALTLDMAPAARETAWEQGYELALRTLRALGLDGTNDRSIDIESVMHDLGVMVRRLRVDDVNLRGVAIAGEGFRPTVIVNASAPWNRSGPGRRFTLAHEFCHVLADRGRARRVTHSSTPWAPEAVERRANAFAAMFLMPYHLVDRSLATIGQITDRHGLRRIAKALRCGNVAVLEHLKNIDRIDPEVFFRIRSEAAPV